MNSRIFIGIAFLFLFNQKAFTQHDDLSCFNVRGFIKNGSDLENSDPCVVSVPLKKVESWTDFSIKELVSDSTAEKKEYVTHSVIELSKIYWGMRVGPLVYRFINAYESVRGEKAAKDRKDHYTVKALAIKGNICVYDSFLHLNANKEYQTLLGSGIYISKGCSGETKFANMSNLKEMVSDDDEISSKLNAMDIKTWYSIPDSKTFSQFMQIITLYNSLDKE